ncbi:histidine kinase [Asanoa ishikariensis]|uniref:Histidine kinase-like ATPase domain-containing protein n=1 Tax=Asanoa ishikariensis TaxID=137265 RepID=A0A1H3UJA1_9ACTN|nr:GAF domain-containing protein [Asanoa ishikariensis]GIF63384.1 histidine kinase [Asanoa ishikariensis]SDZ62407.1 Histidine kinase-like ATPase domain-containing protein [Asanoa ishikariensis]
MPGPAEPDEKAGIQRERGDSSLTFPDAPRLELDQLLGQLVDRAQEVMSTQGRLRGLLHANQLIIGDLALPAVLRRIVEAARELAGARYAALGVVSPTGGLAEFIHSGMPADAVEVIGHLPQGKGLLGALIDDPRPIRLEDIGDDPRSAGFPAGHPPMHSFLGVPIRVRDEVFGNLYLAESAAGAFTAEDEELVRALAATAAVAIDNARLYASAQLRGEWLQASAAITRQVLATEGSPILPLRRIAERTMEVAKADLVTVVLPNPDDEDELRIEVAVGLAAVPLTGTRVPARGTLSGEVFASGRPLRLANPGEGGASVSPTAEVVDIGPVLAVPLHGSARVHGVLWTARAPGRALFTADDVDMAASFANQAALAIELAEARAEQQRVAMLHERERIAADLHDHVIQRLFAAGLSLQGAAVQIGAGPDADRIVQVIDDLDTTISQIRTTIFQLQRQPGALAGGVRGRLLDVATQVAPALGFEAGVRFSGVIESQVPDDLADDLEAVLREALTNVARHADARSAEVEFTVTADAVTLEIRDDGRGIGETTRVSGLGNLRVRAERRGGTLAVMAGRPSGTRLVWSVPLAGPGSTGDN